MSSPSAQNPVFFPNVGLQALSALVHFFGLTIITHCISRRIQHESLSFEGIKTIPWPRLALILMFCDSWLFLVSSGLLVFGFGLEYSPGVCTAAAYSCIVFYSSSKFFVYAFLAEKVHIVWSPTLGVRRLESPVYLICIVAVSIYCIIMTLMLAGPIHTHQEDGACIIGLKPVGSIPVLVYDIAINLLLTIFFMLPLMRSKVMNTTLRRLARKTFIASFIALTTSTINIAVLIALKGRELGWVNLCACAGDIIINAVAVFWVSGGRSGYRPRQSISNGLPNTPNTPHTPYAPRRHQQRPSHTFSDPQFASIQIESIHFANHEHVAAPATAAVGSIPVENAGVGSMGGPFVPSASFPRFLDGKMEGEDVANNEPRKASWFSRLLSRTPKEPQMQVAEVEGQERKPSDPEHVTSSAESMNDNRFPEDPN